MFPPTREWTEAEQAAVFERESIDAGLIVTVGARAASVIPVATHSYGSQTVFGSYDRDSGNLYASGSSRSTSIPIYGAKSTAEFSAVLLDIANNRTAWYGDILVKASGTAFVGMKGDAKGLVHAVMRGLEQHRHVPGKQ